MSSSITIQPVIMAGGSGTRLWPLSRSGFPKQFLSLGSDDSLFQQAVARLMGLAGDGIALAAREGGADPVLVVSPADQTVTDRAAFTAALRAAVHGAASGAIVILGVTPTGPETAYGYIRSTPADGLHKVAQFVEKPDAATAARYLAEGGYTWNSGMFVLRASVWLDALREFRPDILAATEAAWSGRAPDER